MTLVDHTVLHREEVTACFVLMLVRVSAVRTAEVIQTFLDLLEFLQLPGKATDVQLVDH